jgi:hypothetical protein
MTRTGARQDASMVAAPLTDQQAAVLQANYDHFRDHGTWPTFITIGRSASSPA